MHINSMVPMEMAHTTLWKINNLQGSIKCQIYHQGVIRRVVCLRGNLYCIFKVASITNIIGFLHSIKSIANNKVAYGHSFSNWVKFDSVKPTQINPDPTSGLKITFQPPACEVGPWLRPSAHPRCIAFITDNHHLVCERFSLLIFSGNVLWIRKKEKSLV